MRCEQEIAVGAYLLDALEPDEQLRMREHIAQCPTCAETVRELEGVSGLLAGVDVGGLDLSDDVPSIPEPSELAYQRLRSAAAAVPPELPAPRPARAPVDRPAPWPTPGPAAWPPPAAGARAMAPRRSWRLLAVAAAATVVLGGGITGGVVALSHGQPVTTTATATSGGISAQARITPAGSGSRITLTLDGVPIGQTCRLVAVARDGDQSATHWWAVTRPGSLSWTDTVGVPAGDLDHLDVVTADGRTLVTLRS